MKKQIMLLGVFCVCLTSCDDISFDNVVPTDIASKQLFLTNSDLDSLKQELLAYHISDVEYGVVYHTDTAAGDVIQQYRIPDYIDLPKSKINYQELIDNNSKEPLEKRVSSKLLSDFYNEVISDDSEVIISVLFVENVDLPQLPGLNIKKSREEQENQKVLSKIEGALDLLHRIRTIEITNLIHNIQSSNDNNVEILNIQTLIKQADLKVSWSFVKKLIGNPEVQYIKYTSENNAPSDDVLSQDVGNNSSKNYQNRDLNNISDARSLILSDNYYSYTGGYIADIDTGSTLSHVLINGRVTWHRDCVNGTSNNCNTGSNLNPDDTSYHGTASASIVGGGNALGNANRGVTNILMDTFKVYKLKERTITSEAILEAVKRAFPAAIAGGDRTILAELQYANYHSGGGETGDVAMLADNAFDMGYATIAAAGNYGPSASTVASPGNAHKALAIGAFYVTSPYSLDSYSGRGPTSDGRMKPELVAPSFTNAADVPNGNSALAIFQHTSGAVPYAAGAAGLARNFIQGSNTSVDPGLVYAFLINAGTNKSYSQFDNNTGAGYLRLAGPGHSWWGKVTVNQSLVTVPFTISNTYTNLAITIWWPESANMTHKDIRFGVHTNSCDASYGGWQGYYPYHMPDSVWQKYVYSQVCIGPWTLQIIPNDNVNRNQDVYYSIVTWNNAF